MVVEQNMASVTVIFKPRPMGETQRPTLRKEFRGVGAKDKAEAYARDWFANSDVDSIVCKSQCLLVAQ